MNVCTVQSGLVDMEYRLVVVGWGRREGLMQSVGLTTVHWADGWWGFPV